MIYLRQSDAMPGWYVIESNGDDIGHVAVEGSAKDWRNLIAAMRDGAEYHAKRCAVRGQHELGGTGQTRVCFWSPRNSTAMREFAVSTDVALTFADQAEQLVGTWDNETGQRRV